MVQTAFDVPKVPNDSAKEYDGQAKILSGIMGMSKAAQKLKTTKGRIPKSCRTSTMDAAKALGILGFTSTRWLDMSSGLTPKQELDKAHFDKMMAITKKKVIFNEIHTVRCNLEPEKSTQKICLSIGIRRSTRAYKNRNIVEKVSF